MPTSVLRLPVADTSTLLVAGAGVALAGMLIGAVAIGLGLALLVRSPLERALGMTPAPSAERRWQQRGRRLILVGAVLFCAALAASWLLSHWL